MKTYYLKLTALTPLHVGTGEVYEPTNFIIDDGYLYEFDEMLFMQSLDLITKNSFLSKLDDYLQIIDFYKKDEIKSKVKEIAFSKVKVSKKVEAKFKTIRNKDGSKNKNLFEIQKTFKNVNIHTPIIPGSSIKGMLDTVFKIYPDRSGRVENSVRQKLIISDTISLNANVKIGYSYRKHKNPNKEARSDIPQIVEVVDNDSNFIFSIKTIYEFNTIIEKFKKYFNQNSRENSYFKTTNSSFVARVGKFSGKAFMVDDGHNILNTYDKPIATHTLFEDNSPFGWVNIELISENEYKNSLATIEQNEKKYFDELSHKQYNIKQILKQKKEELKAKEEAKQKELEEEQKRLNEEAIRIEEELNSMTPFERFIVELKENYPDKNASESVVVFQAIENEQIDEFKQEALEFVKSKMIEEKVWDKPKKKSAYKRTLKIMEMLSL
ncbi:RAMP superfamily CRISPR-associated protein [Sulfurimonas sp. NW15]|uniref:RAMP superfamily CRISPR-associated protein n=1 Tax=Sulfurimonas sp. NW15 TaxID=2922729 RepID=UPI003DA8FA6A